MLEWSRKQTRSSMDVTLLLYLWSILQIHKERLLQLLHLQIRQSFWNKENFYMKLQKRSFSSIVEFTLESFGDREFILFPFCFFLFCFQFFSVNSTLFCITFSVQLELHKHRWRKNIAHVNQFDTLLHAAHWIFIISFFFPVTISPWDIEQIPLKSGFIYGLHNLPRTLCAFPTCFCFIPLKYIGLNSLLR